MQSSLHFNCSSAYKFINNLQSSLHFNCSSAYKFINNMQSSFHFNCSLAYKFINNLQSFLRFNYYSITSNHLFISTAHQLINSSITCNHLFNSTAHQLITKCVQNIRANSVWCCQKVAKEVQFNSPSITMQWYTTGFCSQPFPAWILLSVYFWDITQDRLLSTDLYIDAVSIWIFSPDIF